MEQQHFSELGASLHSLLSELPAVSDGAVGSSLNAQEGREKVAARFEGAAICVKDGFRHVISGASSVRGGKNAGDIKIGVSRKDSSSTKWMSEENLADTATHLVRHIFTEGALILGSARRVTITPSDDSREKEWTDVYLTVGNGNLSLKRDIGGQAASGSCKSGRRQSHFASFRHNHRGNCPRANSSYKAGSGFSGGG